MADSKKTKFFNSANSQYFFENFKECTYVENDLQKVVYHFVKSWWYSNSNGVSIIFGSIVFYIQNPEAWHLLCTENVMIRRDKVLISIF